MESVLRLLAAIPERTVRTPSGSPLRLAPGAADGRIAYLAAQLNWLTPFTPLSAEGQRILGLSAARERHDRDDDESEAEEGFVSR